MTAAVLCLWLLGWLDASPGASRMGAACVSALVAGAAWRLAKPRPCQLRWDGVQWTAQGQPVVTEVMLDVGGALLLRLRPVPADADRRGVAWRSRWLAVAPHEAAGTMHGLRAALYSRPPSSAPADGTAAAANPPGPE